MILKEEENSWKTHGKALKYETPWISVTEYEVTNPAGKPGIYGVVSFKNLAIGVLPLDEEYNTWIVGQYRYVLEQYSWEIPEGGGALDEDPLDSARRELAEETGVAEIHVEERRRREHARAERRRSARARRPGPCRARGAPVDAAGAFG